jgi:hypothetical protein
VKLTGITDRAAWWAPANGFQPRSEPRVHLAARKIHASQRSGKRRASAHRDPHARVAGRAIAAIAPNFTAVEVDALASRSGQEGRPSQPARSACPGTGPRRRWSRPFRRAHFPGTAEGCPSRGHRPAHDNGKALWGALCLICGTSPERIAPESLTRSLSDFVHGHISWRTALLPPNRVTALTRLPS